MHVEDFLFTPHEVPYALDHSSHRIAAANVEIAGTDVCAQTLHALFDLDGELTSRIDVTKYDCEKVKQLMSLDVLLLDCGWRNTQACGYIKSHTRNMGHRHMLTPSLNDITRTRSP